MTTKNFICFFFCFTLLQSCNIKFDKEKWQRTDQMEPPDERPKMLNDLTKNYKLVGLKYNDLIKLLSIPDYVDTLNHKIGYEIKLHYDIIDPDAGEYLDFDFNKDSIITNYKIRDWKK